MVQDEQELLLALEVQPLAVVFKHSKLNRFIIIPANTLGIQLNSINLIKVTKTDIEQIRQITNINGTKTTASPLPADRKIDQATQNYHRSEILKFQLGFSTACGPLQQVAIYKDNTKLWKTSIYAREQAIISFNSLSELAVNNSVIVSPLESTTQVEYWISIN
ncbi:MAG: hypothetical protein EZS28_020894 [Streblomastix strix]|uniref:Uncharacterized protein n=1 Tax=Streblomastix strix TaxID=222440 RepID=A0A5J4VMN4_9EUKA|nr:MAG: hypothetical protein EZS28_020894 [Streblomastix strix]